MALCFVWIRRASIFSILKRVSVNVLVMIIACMTSAQSLFLLFKRRLSVTVNFAKHQKLRAATSMAASKRTQSSGKEPNFQLKNSQVQLQISAAHNSRPNKFTPGKFIPTLEKFSSPRKIHPQGNSSLGGITLLMIHPQDNSPLGYFTTK